MIIYKIETTGCYGGTLEIPDGSIGIPLWTTRTAPPEIPEGFFAIWNGSGWNISSKVKQIEEIAVQEEITQIDTNTDITWTI